MTRPRLRVLQIVVHYAFAVAVTAFVTSIVVPLRPLIEPRHSPPFLLGVLVVAWVAGFGPAILSSVLSILAMNYFFIPPLHSLRLFSAHELIGAPVFAAVALGMSWLATTRRDAEAERARALARERAARDEAEAANRAKDEFLAVLGHEMRNPLGAITCAVEVLQRTARREDAAGRACETINRQVGNLGRLVDDLVEVNRVLKGKVALNRQPVELSQIVRACVTALGDAGRLGRHLLKLDLEPVWVDADPARLDQVVTNLLDNAVKYTPEHGAISVRLHPVGGRAVLDVRDTGIGIPGALLPRLFDVFVQGDPGSRHSHGGLGIGLTVVRRMVELHGGDVTARSEGAGLGSTFTVRLPRIAAWPAGVP
jgi:signal transduction histidine kinase